MLPEPRRFLEKLAERERAAWAHRARVLNEGQVTLMTHYSVYSVSNGTLARTHARTAGGHHGLHEPDSRWLLIGYLRIVATPDTERRYELCDRGRKGDKAVFWQPGVSWEELGASRFIITSKLAEDPRRVLVRPRSMAAQPLLAETTQVLAMPADPRVPAELLFVEHTLAMTPTTGRPALTLPKTTPPPRRTSYPPPAKSTTPAITPLVARPAARRLPLPSLRSFATA